MLRIAEHVVGRTKQLGGSRIGGGLNKVWMNVLVLTKGKGGARGG